MKRAGEGKAVDADIDVVIRLLQDKYPLTFQPEERDKPTIPNYDKVNPRSSRPTIIDAKAWFYALVDAISL
ncbi:hypothetical protein E4U59_005487 [Claviceps monticola]|nr:hypothetical protein E4U59_005487 [Claviceps monticola]